GQLAGFHPAGTVPEGALDLVVTPGEQVDVIQQLVGVVILGIDTAGACLQAHVDVLGHQYDAVFGVAVLELAELVDDLVVVEVVGQAVRGGRGAVHEDGKGAVGAGLAALDGDPGFHQVGRCIGEGMVYQSDRLAAVGGGAG